MRSINLCHTALRVLKDCDGHPLPENILRQHIDARERPATSEEEFSRTIATLLQGHCIRSMPGEFGDATPRWLITEKGEAMLLKR